MAYNDPYANNAGYGSGSRYQAYDQTNHNAPYYSNQDYDSTGPTYDPYTNNPPYTRAGNTNVRFDDDQLNDVSKEEDRGPPVPNKYDDHESGALARQRSTRTAGASLKSKDSLKVSVVPARKHWNGFEHGEFTPTVPARGRGKSTRAIKEYRFDTRGNLWTKGSRARCCGRFVCCTLMIGVLIVVSVALSLALWIRPPAVTIGQLVTRNTTGSLSSEEGLTINLSVDISIDNPNYFTADFSKIKAEIFYPINNTPMGGGESRNVKFPSEALTNFTFPFAVTYKGSNDPGSAVFVDLGRKCGLVGDSRSNIIVNYKITLGIRFLIITVSPVIENTFSFPCPPQIAQGGGGILG